MQIRERKQEEKSAREKNLAPHAYHSSNSNGVFSIFLEQHFYTPQLRISNPFEFEHNFTKPLFLKHFKQGLS